MLLETYTALADDQLAKTLPKFLQIEREVTGNPDYSMFNLSLKEEWTDTKHFCRSLLNGNRIDKSNFIYVYITNI